MFAFNIGSDPATELVCTFRIGFCTENKSVDTIYIFCYFSGQDSIRAEISLNPIIELISPGGIAVDSIGQSASSFLQCVDTGL